MTSAPTDIPPLDEFLCFATYTTNLAFGRAYKPMLDELGLTYTQWVVLLALAEQDGLTVSELGRRLFLRSNTLTPLLKQLEQQGLLRRVRSQEDERQVILTLTEAGWARREASKSCLAMFDRCGLSAQEMQSLQSALVKLRSNLLGDTLP